MKILKTVLLVVVIVGVVYFAYSILTAQTCVDRAVSIPGDDGCYYLWERVK